jgi:threonine dehydrogenase-like Zn-dependent dehydrogenase
MQSRAAVQTGARRVAIEEMSLPDLLEADMAVLAVEANGMCGSDWEQYRGTPSSSGFVRFPVVPGHETVGRIERLGERARARWGVEVGDRVAVNSLVSCGACRHCLAGRRLFCPERFVYGYTPTTVWPGLWGGYAQHMLLRPNTILYPLDESVSAEDAVLFNPLAAGFDWVCRAGEMRVGDTVVIIGAGQRGLCSIVAAVEAGAARVILAGRGRHPWKLDLARELGATHVVDLDRESLAASVADVTGGEMADVALDTTPIATEPVRMALDCVRPEGVVVLGGIKGSEAGIEGLAPDRLCARAITVRGVVGVGDRAKEQAVRVILSRRFPLNRLHTHTLRLEEIDRALRIMGGEVGGEDALHVTITCT